MTQHPERVNVGVESVYACHISHHIKVTQRDLIKF